MHKFLTESEHFRKLFFEIPVFEDPDVIKTIRISLNSSNHGYVQPIPAGFQQFLRATVRFPVHKILTPSFSFERELKPDAFQNEPHPRAAASLRTAATPFHWRCHYLFLSHLLANVCQ